MKFERNKNYWGKQGAADQIIITHFENNDTMTQALKNGELDYARGIKDFSGVLDTVSKRAPLRRNTDPAEVADAAVFLASALGRGVTGNVLFVDSGLQIMGM